MICELPRFPCSLSKRPLTARGHLAATTRLIDESHWPLTRSPTGTASGLDVLDVDAAGLVWLTRIIPGCRQRAPMRLDPAGDTCCSTMRRGSGAAPLALRLVSMCGLMGAM